MVPAKEWDMAPHKRVNPKKAKPDKHGYRMIPMQFAGECAWCGKRIAVRRHAWWHAQYQHVVCCTEHRLIGALAPKAGVQQEQKVTSPEMEDLRARQAAFIPANRRGLDPAPGGNRRLSGLPIKVEHKKT